MLVQYRMATDAQRDVVERLVGVCAEAALPGWVSELLVRYVPEGSVHAQVYAEYEYRRVRIELGASFFATDGVSQARDFVHELSHALQAPLVAFMDAVTTGTGLFKGRQGAIFEGLYTTAMEAANEDVAEAIWKGLDKPGMVW